MAYPGAGPSPGGLPGRERGRIWLVAVIVVLLAAAGATGGWFLLSHRSHPAGVAAAPASAAHPRPVSAGPGATSAGGGG